MKSILFITITCIISVNCIYNIIGTDLETCFNCICFAVTMCNDTLKCAKNSINESYWEKAGSPTINNKIPSTQEYKNCLKDVNCIYNTMNFYTNVGGSNRDTNCDGKFDCKDRLAVHFKGHVQNYPLESYIYRRFDNCAVTNNIPVREGWTSCDLGTIKEVFFGTK
ncbi:hypothetical protein HHI36_015511 [Cryptolaemus montrouzieri]|uniref:lysozyme n=1 Tax=Cryptolaemus montrouzieri TaxID=559131 RepID=A0ABD2N5S5_9CUCU